MRTEPSAWYTIFLPSGDQHCEVNCALGSISLITTSVPKSMATNSVSGEPFLTTVIASLDLSYDQQMSRGITSGYSRRLDPSERTIPSIYVSLFARKHLVATSVPSRDTTPDDRQLNNLAP